MPETPEGTRMRRMAVALVLAFAALPITAAAAPLAGRWEGTFHGGRGDQAVTLICRPQPGGAITGLLYMGGDLMGPIENGVAAGDSLRFNVMNFDFRASRADDQMSLLLVIAHGRTHEIALRFAGPDTSALAQSPEAAAAARNKTTVPWEQVPDSVFARHHVSASLPPGMNPAVRAGTLLLVGGGPAQDDINAEFIRLAGGKAARIVVIPTAGIDPGDDPAPLLSADRWAGSLGASHVTVLHTTSRARADSEAFVRPLREATAVWLPGGEAGRILVSYMGTRTERELLAVLARGGVIGGTSAGALVWGSDDLMFQAPKDGSPFMMGDAKNLRLGDPHSVGFGALENIVLSPHYTEFHMQPSLAKLVGTEPRLLGIGIDEATALEVHGDLGLVLGRGHVTIVDSRAGAASPILALAAGSRYELTRSPKRER
jgi:cyanophycinase